MKMPATITRLSARATAASRPSRAWFSPVPPPEAGDPAPGPLWSRLLWFAGLCLAGSLSVATLAYALRALPFGG
ncbi:hypothetical protein BH10PSE2_BH10PSE2_04790 [soil metagenome]